jgi:hypothetical protein
MYEWNRIIRNLTNLFYLIIYNTLFSVGWITLAKINQDHTLFNNIGTTSAYIGYGTGHGIINIAHFLLNKISKEKTRKDIVANGNPIPQISATSKVFLIGSLIPFLIWLIGWFVIQIQCSKYKKQTGSLKTQEQNELDTMDVLKITNDVADKKVNDLVSTIVKQISK